MPLATFRHSATAPAPAAEAWAALQRSETWGGIGLIEEVSDEVVDDDGLLTSFAFVSEAAGRTWDGTARRVGLVPDERMELALSTKEIKGRIAVDLVPDGTTTLLEVRLEVEPAGMLASLFWGVVREAVSGRFTRQVEEFAAGVVAS